MKKIIGLILIFLGIVLIIWGIWQSYNIFTGKKEAPEIFKYSMENQTSVSGKLLEDQIQKAIKDQLSAVLPADSVPKILNLVSWSIFMAILVMASAKISLIGIKLFQT